MKNFYIILIIFFSFAIFSCAKKSDSSSSSSTTELEGTWLTSCFSSGSYYVIDTLTVSGTGMEYKSERHADSSCSSDNYTQEFTYSSLSIGDAVTYESGTKTGAYFSMTVSGVTETQNNSYEVNWANGYCGYSDWELNVAKDITGKTCGSTTYVSANTKLLSRYKNQSSNIINLSSFNIESDGYPDSVSSLDFTKQ